MRTPADLHPYQRHGVERVIQHSHSALFLEMGLGKTVTTLTAIAFLISDLDISRVLVVAPKRVAETVWDAEVGLWSHLQGLRVSKIVGTEKQRIRALQRSAEVFTIGRDNLVWLRKRIGKGRPPFDMLVIDELSSFKNQSAKHFQALRSMRGYFDRIVGLTGTPAANGLMDLWAEMYLIDRGERLGRTIGEYRDRYFLPDKRNGSIVYSYKLKPMAEATIHDKIADICVSMKAADYLSLPERVERTVRVELTEGEKRLYDKMEKEMVLELDGAEITALNAAALSTKLLQLAGGVVYDSDGVAREVHSAKLEALEEIVEDANGEPVLIAWTFRHDRDRILKRLAEYKPVELQGAEEIDRWNRGEIKVLMMHPASGGHGLNLQAGGRIVVWYGLTWSLELYQQLNARLHRQGQKGAVIIHRLAVEGTIDFDVLAALERKETVQDALMEAVKAKINKYFLKKV